MRDDVIKLIDHYATVTDGSSALLRADLLAICNNHAVTETEFCNAFAKELAETFAAGQIDADGSAFAADDLHDAADYSLSGFARSVFVALEYGEASPSQVRQILAQEFPGNAA